MRLSVFLWLPILLIVIHSIVDAESKKSKVQSEEIEENSNRPSQKWGKKSKNYNNYESEERNSNEEVTPKFKSKDRSKKKQDLESNGKKFDYNKGELKDKKNIKKRNKATFENEQGNNESDESIEVKYKHSKNRKEGSTNSEGYKKKPKKSNQQSSSENETSRESRNKRKQAEELEESEEDSQVELKTPKRKQKHEKLEESETKTLLSRRKRQVVEETPEESEDAESDETAVGEVEDSNSQNDSKFCSKRDSDNVDYACNEEDDSGDTDEENEIQQPKKMKYSTKFAHEKASKKPKNKEAENILKLHRKAEINQKSAKLKRRENRLLEDDEDSNEDVIPRRRPTLFEDEEV